MLILTSLSVVYLVAVTLPKFILPEPVNFYDAPRNHAAKQNFQWKNIEEVSLLLKYMLRKNKMMHWIRKMNMRNREY